MMGLATPKLDEYLKRRVTISIGIFMMALSNAFIGAS
jgi:hypothetical protein